MISTVKNILGFNKVKTARLSGTRDLKWVHDLQAVKKGLARRHKNLFFKLRQETFYSEIQTLIDRVPDLSDDEIKVKLMTLIASVGDGHTIIWPKNCLTYPIRFYFFDDGIYITMASQAYEDLIGSRVLAINDHDIQTVVKDLKACTSADNAQQEKNRMAYYLACPHILRGLGLVGEKTTLTLSKEGRKTHVDLIAGIHKPEDWIRGSKVLHESKLEEKYWYQASGDGSYMYLQYNECIKDKDRSFKTLVKEMFHHMESSDMSHLVVDIRHNAGGASWIINPLFRAIKRSSRINQKNHLYLIIGRRTFSSALMNTIAFMKKTPAILVGEGTGGAPNGYGEVFTFHLSNVDMDIYYSTAYFKQMDEDINAIEPDMRVSNMASDYFKNRDRVLETIEDHIAGQTC